MGRGGRPRSSSNVSNTLPTHQSRPPTSSPQLKRQYVLASDSIYQNNMTVLRRRDPSITAILDQFPHVCLYHFNGVKWEKQGFEGSMFLVEHSDAPPYGLYILNRMGTGDYGRRIYPEDDMQILGDYLMYRFYPEYTAKRTQMGLPYPLPPEYRPMFDQEFAVDRSSTNQQSQSQEKPNPNREKKGTSVTTGLWMFPTEAREPLKDVMIRCRGESYPVEFRYGPGRPPPPNHHSRKGSQVSISTSEDVDKTPRVDNHPNPLATSTASNTNPPGNGVSELDKLFAKLQPTVSAKPPNVSGSAHSAQSLIAALTNSSIQAGSQNAATSTPSAPPPSSTPSTSSRGLALLDSIFASCQPPSQPPSVNAFSSEPTSQTSQQPGPEDHLPPHPEEIQIVSPKPQSSQLPQILNQDVIATLLGLSPSTPTSASSRTGFGSRSSSVLSAPRYEGDNEYSDVTSDVGYSTTSTVADSLSQVSDPAILATGPARNGIPSVSYQASSDSDGDHNSGGSAVRRVQGIQGDVTPRVVTRGIGPGSPPIISNQKTPNQQFLTTSNGNGKIAPSSVSTATMKNGSVGMPQVDSASTLISTLGSERKLVPFESNSELWPYPRAPVDESSSASGTVDSDVVELDFSDTRALSDPSVFSKKQKQATHSVKTTPEKGKKKSRRERAMEREERQRVEREAIENGWDDPMGSSGGGKPAVDMTSRPGAPVQVQPPSLPTATTIPATNGKGKSKQVNGAGDGHKLDADVTQNALLSALLGSKKAPPKDISRKQFVQEVLTLIYSDNAFVDNLYQTYTQAP
ncbi:hypothetical protein C8Q75DRAFT_803541 [Abortiporus biennis]|nr:hypothetical protein C8Q75DRAFT_803541 [Abortiporus biennis]